MKTDPEVIARLERIENLLTNLVEQEPPKEFYTTAEVAQILGKAEFTVREWCRLGRIHVEKRQSGRGRSKEWMINHIEIRRIQNKGLLSLD